VDPGFYNKICPEQDLVIDQGHFLLSDELNGFPETEALVLVAVAGSDFGSLFGLVIVVVVVCVDAADGGVSTVSFQYPHEQCSFSLPQN
jgi:hypothetical protein